MKLIKKFGWNILLAAWIGILYSSIIDKIGEIPECNLEVFDWKSALYTGSSIASLIFVVYMAGKESNKEIKDE